MKKITVRFFGISALFLVGSQTVFSATWSAVRAPGESFQDSYRRVSISHASRADDAYSSRRPFIDIDYRKIPEWSSEELKSAYSQIRERRFLSEETQPDFLRRITWTYAADGCWMRAEQARRQLKNFQRPQGLPVSKIFLFGDLQACSPFEYGCVSWWYHVAPIVQSAGKIYVLDVALSPLKPLLLTEWFVKSGQDPASPNAFSVSLCDGKTYGPDAACSPGVPEVGAEELNGDTQTYLGEEWNFHARDHRDPRQVLGESPPWKLSRQ